MCDEYVNVQHVCVNIQRAFVVIQLTYIAWQNLSCVLDTGVYVRCQKLLLRMEDVVRKTHYTHIYFDMCGNRGNPDTEKFRYKRY